MVGAPLALLVALTAAMLWEGGAPVSPVRHLFLVPGVWAALTAGAHGLVQAVLLAALIAVGMAIYGLFLRLFGVAGWREAVNAFRQSAP